MNCLDLAPITESIYLIKEKEYAESCNCYLVVGSEKCLLIDVGIGLTDLSWAVRKIAKGKEVVVVLTHFHFDHFGGSWAFPRIYAHLPNSWKKDFGTKYLKKKHFSTFSLYLKARKNSCPFPEKYVQVREKEKIDLGNFQFEVICTPGHDSTGICLLEREKKIVFTGDLLYDGKLYYSFPDSDLRKYLSSLKKIQDTRPKLVCGGHNAPVANSVKTFISSKIKEIESAISMKQRKCIAPSKSSLGLSLKPHPRSFALAKSRGTAVPTRGAIPPAAFEVDFEGILTS